MNEEKALSPRQQRIQEERIRLAQVLLNRPWIRKDEDPDLYHKLREHHEALRDWFQEMCGFPLILTRELIKLEKVPGKAATWMGFPEFSKGLDYALFTYCLWYLEGKSELEQFLLSELVEEVSNKLKLEGFEFDQVIYPQRLSLKRALKKLCSLGVLHVVDGDEEEWVHHYQDQKKNVLYECTPLTRYVMRRFAQDVTAVREITQLGEGIYSENHEGKVLRRKHKIFRRFVQEPLVLDDQWDEEELYYVKTQRSYLMDQLNKMLGLSGRRYKEGLLFYHPTPKGEMQLFPTAKSISDLVLLLATEVRRHREADPNFPFLYGEQGILVTRSDLETLVLEMRETYQRAWSKHDREEKIGVLVETLIAHMEEWGLAEQLDEQQVRLTAGLGRWFGSYKQEPEEGGSA